jgi:lysophospholipase L1-like esterase
LGGQDRIEWSVAAVNSTIAKSADGKVVRFLGIGDRFLEGDGRIHQEIMPDFLHLSPMGYEIWAKAIETGRSLRLA